MPTPASSPDLLKQDAALSLRLLRYINSAANALPQPVSSIEHALALLGREKPAALADPARVHRGQGGRTRRRGARDRAGTRAHDGAAGCRPPCGRVRRALPGRPAVADRRDPAGAARQGARPARAGSRRSRPRCAATMAPTRPCSRSRWRASVERPERVRRATTLRAAAAACGIAPEQASECHLQALSWAMQIQD
jgi:EAL and modified HD-GYP domain-containing signal transduction protein